MRPCEAPQYLRDTEAFRRPAEYRAKRHHESAGRAGALACDRRGDPALAEFTARLDNAAPAVPVRHATAGAPDEQPLRKAPEGPAVLRKIRGAPPSLAGAGEFCAPPPRRTARGMRGLRTPAYLGVH